MRIILLTFLFFAFQHVIHGQNMVSNPSFEDVNKAYLQCGYYQSKSDFNAVFNSEWLNAGQGTPDIYSKYVDTICTMYPTPFRHQQTFVTNRYPHTGNNMAGIINYSYYFGYNSNYREYLQNKLVKPLVVNQKYKVVFYFLLQENSYRAANNMGVFFSEQPIPALTGPNDYQLKVNPQIEYSPVIKDYTNWVKLDTIIEATENWQYITIGNFRDDSSTQVVNMDTPANSYYFLADAYYFIDDVSVEPICTKTYAKQSDTICYGHTATLTAPDSLQLRGWADSAQSNTIISTGLQVNVHPLKSSTYYLYVNYCDTIVYKIHVLGSLHVDLGKDRGFYKDQVIILDATNKNATYQWQDNAVEPQYTVNQTGKYWVEVSDDEGCKVSDTIKLTEIALEMPNVFTPTSDHVNDYFVPITMSGIRSAELSIYNRWGSLICKTSDLNQGWDGADATAGEYYWDIKYTDINGINGFQKGELTLIR